MLEKPEIKKRLKMAFWDYNYSEDELYAVLFEEAQIEYLPQERIYQRLLETYSWYQLLEIVPKEQIQKLLAENIIKKLRFPQLRNRYYYVRELLF